MRVVDGEGSQAAGDESDLDARGRCPQMARMRPPLRALSPGGGLDSAGKLVALHQRIAVDRVLPFADPVRYGQCEAARRHRHARRRTRGPTTSPIS